MPRPGRTRRSLGRRSRSSRPEIARRGGLAGPKAADTKNPPALAGRGTRLVEAAGIEPASASPTSKDLHAYPRLLISLDATRRAGKTYSQLRFGLAVRPSAHRVRELVRDDAWDLSAQARPQPDGTLLGFRQRVRSCRRWQLSVCKWIYEEPCTSACTLGFATHVETGRPLGSRHSLRPMWRRGPAVQGKWGRELFSHRRKKFPSPFPQSSHSSSSSICSASQRSSAAEMAAASSARRWVSVRIRSASPLP
jgi:hypothetical protein